MHIPSQVAENLLFSNRRERVKLFHDRMCRTRGSILRPLRDEMTDQFFDKVKMHVGQNIVVKNVQKPVHIHLKMCSNAFVKHVIICFTFNCESQGV